MSLYHEGPYTVDKKLGIFSFISKTRSPKNLVIFIHGFMGKSIGTWEQFPTLLTDSELFKDSDIFFYGYQSLRSQATSSASLFHDFLDEAVTSNKYRHPDKEHEYKKIIIVAHSLGAIVTRYALLNAKRLKKYWLQNCRMVLFGPAHNGARINNLILECATPFMRVVIGLGMFFFPTIEDLETGSVCLNTLNDLTNGYLQKNDGDFTKAFNVIWALNDNVVYNFQFHDDSKEETIRNVGHKSVCKPINSSYLKPMEVLENAII